MAKFCGEAIDAQKGTITLAYPFEPPQLDGTRATDVTSSFVLGHIMEGLLRLDEHGEIAPGVAESWEIEPDHALFHLRANALWSDGKPVTAADFVFAWRKVVEPANASEYAFIMYPLKNAEAISKGQLPLTSLGVRAIDDQTLRVDFQQPIAFFDKLATFKTYFPIREDFYNDRPGRYGADAADLLYNGPFVLARWVHGAQVRFEKNDRYWEQGEIRLQRDRPSVHHYGHRGDAQSLQGRQDSCSGRSFGLDPEQLDDVMAQRWPMQRFNEGAIFFLEFNHRAGRVTENRNLRKAMQLVFDPGELVNQVIKLPGYLPGAVALSSLVARNGRTVPSGISGRRRKPDVEEARRYLELARQELNIDAWPPISLLWTTGH